MTKKKTNEALIDEIKAIPLPIDVNDYLNKLLCVLSKDWKSGLVSLRRSQVLVNQFGGTKTGRQINEVINILSITVPQKYKSRYLKYFQSIVPLNELLEELSKTIMASDLWALDKEFCLASLLARFEAECAHIDFKVKKHLDNQKDNMIDMGKSIFLDTINGGPVQPDVIIQQLAASLDRNLRFIEYHLKRTPLVNLAISPEPYKAGTLQITGELWNSLIYLVNKVSLFDWNATSNSRRKSIPL